MASVTRSVSQKLRLYEDTESSPMTPTNYILKSPHEEIRSHSNHRENPNFDQMSYKYYRNSKHKNSHKGRNRPMTSQHKTQEILIRKDYSKDVMSQNITIDEHNRMDRPVPHKKSNLEHGEGYENLQQANMNSSEASDANISDELGYIPNSILAKNYKKHKNKKRIVVMKKKNRPTNYNANEDLISESSAQGYKNRARNMYRGDTQESSSLKGLFHNRMSRDVSGEEDSLAPLGTKMNLDSEANENVRSSSSVLVPLGDHESLFSPKGSEKNEDYAQEENEKAAVIQRMYRKKMEKRREQEEQNEKATLIQRKYKEKLEKRRLAEEAKERQTKTQKEEREEENEKAAMIQRMYRAKKTKQKLVEEKHRKEENEKATMIQRMYRQKKKKQNNHKNDNDTGYEKSIPKVVINKPIDEGQEKRRREEEERAKEENEKAAFIQRMYRDKKQKTKKPQIDHVLGVPIDDEMQNKASFIQRHYRQKKAKEAEKLNTRPKPGAGSLSSKIQSNIVEENLISDDPRIRREQEEKAAYIQQMFRSKQSKKLNPKLREQEENFVPNAQCEKRVKKVVAPAVEKPKLAE